MGMFDTVFFRCPKCDALIEEQSKGADEPMIRAFVFPNVPDDVMSGLSNPICCPKCSTKLKINSYVSAYHYYIVEEDEDNH
jgi:hypothetical protein